VELDGRQFRHTSYSLLDMVRVHMSLENLLVLEDFNSPEHIRVVHIDTHLIPDILRFLSDSGNQLLHYLNELIALAFLNSPL
jgi:hypothetical protein